MDLDDLSRQAAAWHLEVMGVVHGDDAPDEAQALVLFGPLEPGFWAFFREQTEYQDGAPNPVDRWSMRAIGTLARTTGSVAFFPFGGPPHQPFLTWAMASGRCQLSPVGMLVHDRQGLMVSFRGALAFTDPILAPPPPEIPCTTCVDRPCLEACPVGALSAETGYDTVACHGFLDTDAGDDCLSQGCRARRACPVSQSYGRLPEQSAFHMRTFHPS
jgi:epoxyqueuosine reductase